MTQETYISLTELVVMLRQICVEHKTGIMYITSSTNRSAQVMIDKGKIVFIYYFNKRGRDALALMSEIESGRFRFQEGAATALRADLPATDDILKLLSSVSDNTAASNMADVVKNQVVGLPLNSGPKIVLTKEQKQVLEDGLAVFIGPMATIICEDHLESATDAKMAMELLAREIPTESQAKSFREEMQRKLFS